MNTNQLIKKHSPPNITNNIQHTNKLADKRISVEKQKIATVHTTKKPSIIKKDSKEKTKQKELSKQKLKQILKEKIKGKRPLQPTEDDRDKLDLEKKPKKKAKLKDKESPIIIDIPTPPTEQISKPKVKPKPNQKSTEVLDSSGDSKPLKMYSLRNGKEKIEFEEIDYEEGIEHESDSAAIRRSKRDRKISIKILKTINRK